MAWAEAKHMSTAYASALEGWGHEKLSFTDGFQAKLSWHNTNEELEYRWVLP